MGNVIEKKKNLMDFFGVFKDDAEYWEEFERKVYENRKKMKFREIKL